LAAIASLAETDRQAAVQALIREAQDYDADAIIALAKRRQRRQSWLWPDLREANAGSTDSTAVANSRRRSWP
jgi:hypothetical protein